MLDRVGERYGELLHRHLEILRAAVVGHDGTEVDNQGDAIFAVFERPADAVAAASKAQQGLASESWPDNVEVRVRIGIHTGAPRRSRGRYVGHDVHRAARISAAAHGGQVVLSSATQALLPEARVRDLGHHRLKDIPQPVRLFQLLGDGLDEEFPPLRTLRATNLPLPPTRLVGRERELADVRSLLRRQDVRLVTLSGPGGAGKTKLAVHVATDLVAEFEGVFFVPLGGVAEAELVPSALAQAVGVRGESPELAVAQELEGRSALILLDNFEHVLSAGEYLAELLRSVPGPTFLVTSRERLNLRSEYEYALAPLAEEDAVALFWARASAAAPDLSVDRDDTAVVSRICRRLDCLPLAIELAAARARVLSPAELLLRLDRRLPLLTGGPRDLPPRQRGLRSTIEWSHDLLEEPDRRAFARLAVFAGGFTVEAAEQVVGEGDVVGSLTSLVDKNLLARQQGGEGRRRFVMLDTIREYALEQLDAKGETRSAHALSAAFFVALAERLEPELRGARQAETLQELEGDIDNLRAALAWTTTGGDDTLALRLVGALWRFWHAHGYLQEGRDWLDAALRSGDGEPAARAGALLGATVLAATQGDRERAQAYAEERLVLCRELADPEALASALATLANVSLEAGDLDRASALYEEAAVLATEHENERALAAVVGNRAYLALLRSSWVEAASLSSEACALYRRLGHESNLAVALLNHAFAQLYVGGEEAAVGDLEEAAALCGRLGDREGLSYCFEGIAAATANTNAAHSALLLGVSDALRSEVGATLQAHERRLHEQTLALLRDRLGDGELGRAMAEGASLPHEDALARMAQAASSVSTPV